MSQISDPSSSSAGSAQLTGALADSLTCPLVEFYSAETYRPDDSVAYLMRRILSLIALAVERELACTGLTNAQWVPLLKLHMGKASTVAELARECDLDAGSMTRLLDRLEAKGLCLRERSLQDRRVVNLVLTDTGRSAAERIPAILSRVQNAHLAGFSMQEWALLKTMLTRILANAKPLQAANEKK
jgi:DNA-binding MarR family transcriptional regulator